MCYGPKDCGTAKVFEEQAESLSAAVVLDVAVVAGSVGRQSNWGTTEAKRLAYFGKPVPEIAAGIDWVPE